MSVKNWEFGAQTISTKGYDGPKADAKATDKKIKYCPDCETCWMLSEFTLPNKYEPEYYHDFPMYGKQVLSCPRCQNG